MSWTFEVVDSSIKLRNARTTAAVFNTKMSPPWQLCQQQILPDCVKFVGGYCLDAVERALRMPIPFKIMRVQNWNAVTKNYFVFMIPKPKFTRLSISMGTSNNWQSS